MDAVLARLCLALLECDRSCAPAVADRMEAVGKTRLAGRVRRRTGRTRRGRLAIVDMALPDQVSDRLGCDFAERVLPIWEAAFPYEDRPRWAIEVRRDWLDGVLPFSDLNDWLDEMYSFFRTILVPFARYELYRKELAAGNAAMVAYGLSFPRPCVDSPPACSPRGGGHAWSVSDWALAAVGKEHEGAELDWQLSHITATLRLLTAGVREKAVKRRGRG